MNVALEIKRADSETLIIDMTGFRNAQPLQLEVVTGYDRCDGEEHILTPSREPRNSWPETVTIPASVRAISCIRIGDQNHGLSTTVRQDGKLLASSWRTVSESGRVLTEIRTGLNIRSGYYYRAVLVWDKK
jgi:hypothetical protein